MPKTKLTVKRLSETPLPAKREKIKVAVGMSGGVDSSVAAALLKRDGYQVSGITMRIWDGDESLGDGLRHGCYGPGEAEDIEDAREIARTLGIDFHVFDLRQEYRTEVLDYFCDEYLSGRTPNPCPRCNSRIKFAALLKKAQDSGIEFDYFATGHYARVEYESGQRRYLLKKAWDLTKDQTYFISSLTQSQLAHTLFPIGNYTKTEVKKMAADFGLKVADKMESQDFVAGGYSSLIAGKAQPGPILDKQSHILGEHQGIPFYTIGQRRRLGISAKEPLYVTDIDCGRNAIIVGGKEELYRDELIASALNWIAVDGLEQPTRLKAKIRYAHQEAEAMVTPLVNDRLYVKFTDSQLAITPGQTVVFYDGDMVICGGKIERAGG
ncbi:MAG: tRNA 2-thiouridine(34) synthase MnmA [Chloroflexi bacterium]|nr:tRNA 2-thiouridine(34) synthase MnmA [Chloroflexota bacterium]